MATTLDSRLPDEITRGDNINLECTIVSPDDGNKSQLTALVSAGSKVVNVADGSLFAAGDSVETRELPLKQPNEIDSIDVNEITLVDPILSSMSIAGQLFQVDVPQDITGATITFTMKKSLDLPDIEASIQETATILDQVTDTGKALLQLDMTVEPGIYWYDIQFVDLSGSKTTLVRDKIEILQDITES